MAKDIISSILKEGTIVGTKLGYSNIWLENIVYKRDNHNISIALINGYLENIIMLGQTITLKYSEEQKETIFAGKIIDIHPEFPSHVTISIESIKELQNSRTFPRSDVYLASDITCVETLEQYFVVVHNISLVGMAFYSKEDFKLQDNLFNINIYLPEDKIINAKGQIKRKVSVDELFDYGMEYVEMKEDTSNLLAGFFNSLNNDRARLNEEYITRIKKYL